MANARKPDNVHLLEGTFQSCRHGDPSKKPKPKGKIEACPDTLSGDERLYWDKAITALDGLGLLTNADEMILSQYAVLAAEFMAEKKGFTAAKHTQLRLLQIELGMTPLARSKITVSNDEDDDF